MTKEVAAAVRDETPGMTDDQPVQRPNSDPIDDPGTEPVEEWPPRAWRETTRSAGHRQAAWVAFCILLMFGILTAVAIWASQHGNY